MIEGTNSKNEVQVLDGEVLEDWPTSSEKTSTNKWMRRVTINS
jgi:hypothetical protein